MTMSNRAEVKSMTGGRTRREAMAGAALVLGGLGLIGGSTRVWAADAEEISRTAEAIHQEPMFKASRKRVYEALIGSHQLGFKWQFDAVLVETAQGVLGNQQFADVAGRIVQRRSDSMPAVENSGSAGFPAYPVPPLVFSAGLASRR